LGKIEGGAPQERHGLLAVFLSRLENWKEIEYGHPVGDVPIQKAAAIFQKDQSVLLAWLRAGMPHAKAGDWQTGERFVIRMAWAMEWSALVLHTGRAFGNHAVSLCLLNRRALTQPCLSASFCLIQKILDLPQRPSWPSVAHLQGCTFGVRLYTARSDPGMRRGQNATAGVHGLLGSAVTWPLVARAQQQP
jgi:hypothetical protein